MNNKAMPQTAGKRGLMVAAGLGLLLATSPLLAGDDSKHQYKIEIRTGDLVLTENDLSHLQPGDSESFQTADGKEVLVSRTLEGYELFNGEKTIALPMPLHGDHASQLVEIIEESVSCTNGQDCEEHRVYMFSGDEGDIDIQSLHEADGMAGHKVVVERIADCGEEDCEANMWFSDDHDVLVESVDGAKVETVIIRKVKEGEEI